MTAYKYTKTFTYDGKRYYIRGNTLEEVAAKMALKKRDLESGAIMTASTMTVEAWCEKCTRLYKTNVKDKTLEDFEYMTNKYIVKTIGKMKMTQVKPLHLQEVLNETQGKSATLVNSVFHAVRFFFSKAKANGIISQDISAELVKPQAKKKATRRALTPEERKNIIDVGFTKRKYYLFMLMLFCGCRPSEAASATGADIELHDGFNVLHVRGTKTALSDRFVPIPDILFNYIKNTPKNEYIAVYENGNMITRDNRRRCWQSFVREVNLHMGAKTYRNKLLPPLPLADDLVPYCLRHEYCTELARRGVDIRVAQKLMGHSNIRMTANVYTNLEAYDVLSVADMLDATKSATQSATP